MRAHTSCKLGRFTASDDDYCSENKAIVELLQKIFRESRAEVAGRFSWPQPASAAELWLCRRMIVGSWGAWTAAMYTLVLGRH